MMKDCFRKIIYLYGTPCHQIVTAWIKTREFKLNEDDYTKRYVLGIDKPYGTAGQGDLAFLKARVSPEDKNSCMSIFVEN